MHTDDTVAGVNDAASGPATSGLRALLQELGRLEVRLSADGDRLGIHAPRGVLTGALRDRLGRHKDELLDMLRRDSAPAAPLELPLLVAEPARWHEPFALTPIQHAYWLGRDSAMEMGDVATHLYVELDCEGLDVARLNDALCRMIERHGMLRAVVAGDGTQRILTTAPRYRIAVDDQLAASPEAAEQAIARARDALSHQVLQADQWPLFDIRATLLPASRTRLHVSLDLLILDAWSIFLFFRNWHRLYLDPGAALPGLGLSFRDYVVAEHALQDSAAYHEADAYWMGRIDTLPAAPDLPLRSDPAARKSPRFCRREARVAKARWDKLKAAGRGHGLTPSGVLLAAYAEVLARWSATPHFTLNVTVSNRLPLHPDVNHLLGDFTSLALQEVDRRDGAASFLQFARNLQRQFAADMEHRQVSGVKVLREWAKRRGISLQAAMPVVFSSGLIWTGDDEVGDLEQFGKKVHSISQTSQVWLDHHVMELQGDLHFVWDAAEAVFEDGVLDAMFAAYRQLVERLADDPAAWLDSQLVPLPADMAQRREDANRSAGILPAPPLHAGFVSRALCDPQAVAVVDAERTLSYGDLLAESAAVAEWLRRCDVRPGQPVAVLMHKGWEQIVAVFGVLLAGGAYLPVDANLPPKRQLELLRLGEVAQVLTQPGMARDEILGAGHELREVRAGVRADFGATHRHSLETAPDQLAYVIFTSGTTGVPKGVMIDHRGATNTVASINRLFAVRPTDRVLAVSSLSFDLSVYDIFGVLGAGGALVIPDHCKGHDPVHWRELIAAHRVTFWNSAPQLMAMLTDSFQPGDDAAAALRTVLLSGDFIPPDLPTRIRQRYPSAQVVSLGGATEASIWSIYYPIGAVAPDWTSIPYGKPLPNQTVWVCDRAMRPCPDHVKGRIYIGGVGLAKGYWRDQDKTAASFVTHPRSGERLYDTGDLGRYAADGNILILGRDDGQVKIRGHRVELGEIEAVLRQHGQIRQAVVLATPGPGESRQLAAYIEPAGDRLAASNPQLNAEAVRNYLAEHLPEYMVPRHVALVERIPLSANGKIDHGALPPVDEAAESQGRELVAPRNAVERVILDAWSRVIVGCEIGVTDNFFELGGDSIQATQLVRELNAALPLFKLEMHELFENLTIEGLAALYPTKLVADGAIGSAPRPLGAAAPSVDRAAMIADLDAAVAELAALRFEPRPDVSRSPPQAVFLTGATGWVGAHVLAELLAQTGARVHCLVRATGKAAGRVRLEDALRRYGIKTEPSWMERVEPVVGDLTQARFGLDDDEWRRVAESIDSIYHFAASVNVLADYATHSKVNVAPIVPLVCLAFEGRRKALFCGSPMTVCRRHREGRLVVLHEERHHADPDGLLTGYAQSKWAAEQVLGAVEALPIKIYRSSHALPSARSGVAKPNDTYGSVLKVASAAGVIPDWKESGFHGVPVDVLSRLMVENSLSGDDYRGVVHIENLDPLSFKSLLEIVLGDGEAACADSAYVSLGEWKARCLEAADRLPDEDASLAKLLFADRDSGAAVENMFAAHPVDTGYFERLGQLDKLAQLTPPAYWRKVRHEAGRAAALQ